MRRRYSQEQQEAAVKLTEEGGVSVQQISRELGVGYSTLQKWRSKYAGKMNTPEKIREGSIEWSEYHRLKNELSKERLKVEVLKKAITYFNQG